MHILIPLIAAVGHHAGHSRICVSEIFQESFVSYMSIVGNPSTGNTILNLIIEYSFDSISRHEVLNI